MPGYLYILKCVNGQYYTGSTNNLERRLHEHWNGQGANFTKKHPPVEVVYTKKFSSIAQAFYKEKQIQKWGRAKKEALINGKLEILPELAKKKFGDNGS